MCVEGNTKKRCILSLIYDFEMKYVVNDAAEDGFLVSFGILLSV